jgi:CBS-domain-containing membrane protein
MGAQPMDIAGRGQRVQVFIDEGDHVEGKSLYTTILKRLHAEGAAGATVTRGIAGFGAHSRIHTATLVDIASPLPLVITWIDAPDRVERLLPILCDLVPEGLITVEDVNIVKYSHRDVSAVPVGTRVGDVMTRDVITVHPETPLAEVVDRLLGQDFRAVPVVNAERHVVGIITNGDLVERGGLPARLELMHAMTPDARHSLLGRATAATAAAVMTSDPVAIAPDAPIASAAETMVSRKLKRMPVIDAERRLVGIISRVDLLRALGEGYPAAEESGPTGNATVAVVGDLMTRHVPVVRESARLAEVLDVVISTRLNRAVVIDEQGHVKGIISDADVMQRLDPHARTGVLGALMGRNRAIPEAVARTTAAELMRTPPVTVPAQTPVEEAARTMIAARRKVLPIVDEHGVLVGVVDRAHLLAVSLPDDSEPSD